ncbi:hypothetical protein, partial [Chloroflexus sp.]|uniref:hypothetical protein n=1 Tax=Chloroflexus sp. TaxID=1904827 RepID=UPI002ACEE8E0
MKLSEFARSISEIDVALGRLTGFACTEEGCEGMWATCDNRSMEIAREVLDKLRKLGLPDLLAELEKIVGRQVTVDDVCVFTEINWLYSDCVLSETASKERCREKLRRALEGARKRLKSAP